MDLPYMRKPCNDCPFRKNATKGWLGEERMRQILDSSSFVCHKTLSCSPESKKQCAGFMLLMQDESAFLSMAKKMGIDIKLTGREFIFDTKQDCIEHHKN